MEETSIPFDKQMITLITENLEGLQDLIRKVKEHQLSMKNTKLMTPRKPANFSIGGEDVEMVDRFCLLSSITNNTGSSTQEVPHRLALGRTRIKKLERYLNAMICFYKRQKCTGCGLLCGSLWM